MNKKGIELGINFIVILILAIVIFGFGIVLFKQMFLTAKTIETDLTLETQEKIEQYIRSGERVAVPVNTREVNARDVVFFGVGILNVDGGDRTFKVILTHGPAYKDDGTDIETSPKPVFKTPPPLDLKNNQNDIVEFPVTIPRGTVKGTYIIDVEVQCPSCSQNPYGEAKIYIKVK